MPDTPDDNTPPDDGPAGAPAGQQEADPLHGITLRMMVERLHAELGWTGLAEKIHVKCFEFDPGIESSLKFLRRTPWAREKVELLYLYTFHKKKAGELARRRRAQK